MRKLKKLNNKKGFTLVEIIVVLVILAILAAATVPAMIGFVNDARGKAFVAEARVGLSAAQAIVTELVASDAVDSIDADGVIDWSTNDAGVAAEDAAGGATTILTHPTFFQMCQDVSGVTVDSTTGDSFATGGNPFTSITVSTSGDSRVTGIVYDSNPGGGTPAVVVTIAGGTTTVTRRQ